ncbi:Protein-glutamate methylesterase/protein-glutamine glutaminase [Methylobacterium adhaesivum]|uniref:Response regulator n=1 Tax=Methylobacterium adhaesivum TaxID=333297 RepID=A0ABT8BD02_9HYPH|nr:DNA-binding response regulator [Methylobacterium adhaesivum]MDN3589089.1 response regulator [Methylobacterium adhaesivum]GJD31975.1 Protein-glutamate methylesterase/protein-glutamine glutaminase [Methylobacterium adhaesivum]
MSEVQRDIVLVVDDSPDTLSFLTEAIERSGATVLVAVAGDLALSLVDEITPDIILMDAVMPGMDGFETCRRLKARGHLAHVPVIFMTGLSETEHIVRGLEAGGVDYVTKPIAPDEILARIRVHLAGARVAQSARAALDTAGRTLFAVDGQGAILWSTPQAARLLAGIAPPDGAGLPPQARAWLVACRAGTTSGALTLTDGNGIVHTLSVIGGTGDEILLRLARDSGEAGIERLRARLPVTGREAEVLLWLSRGKASRDIGEILGLSPRTVTKHLEGIYAKLGVENRTAASLIAARHLQDLE